MASPVGSAGPRGAVTHGCPVCVVVFESMCQECASTTQVIGREMMSTYWAVPDTGTAPFPLMRIRWRVSIVDFG